VNHASLQSGCSAHTFSRLELHVVPAAFSLRVDFQGWAHCVPRVLLGVELCWGLALPTFEEDFVTNLTAGGWAAKLNHGSILELTAENHTVGFVACEFLCFQVAKHDNHSVLHGLNGHKVLEARGNLTDFTIADIDLLTVELD